MVLSMKDKEKRLLLKGGKMKRFLTSTLLLTFLLCFLAGCTQYWYQEEKTFNECKRECRECMDELKKYADLDSPTAHHPFGLYEDKFIDECMKQRGYKLVFEGDIPLFVKRKDPHWWPSWYKRGLAGTLDE